MPASRHSLVFRLVSRWGCGLIIAFSALFSHAVSDGILKGVVTDSEGAAISGARVVMHWDSSGAAVGLKSNVGSKSDLVEIGRAHV